MNIRNVAYQFHQRGIFINSIEYPAVPVAQQRFRISLMATHTKEDIDKLLSAIEEVWEEQKEAIQKAA
jgi:glycine C-acetyltransferase